MPQKSSSVRYVNVGESADGQRVDNFLLREFKGMPRSHVYRLLRTGQVRVDGGRVKPARKLRLGEKVRLPPWVGSGDTRTVAPSKELKDRLAASILYEDEAILAINKPAGLAVHTGTHVTHGVIEVLRAMRPEAGVLELAHRLDRATSGCLLVAKQKAALGALHDIFRDGRIHKRYVGLLAGRWEGQDRRVDLPLGRTRRGGEQMVSVQSGGKHAVTLFRPRLRLSEHVLADIEIDTGRTHQIRVHAASINHPVAGDRKYGDQAANRRLQQQGLKRMFLHAACLEFELNGRHLELNAPLDPSLEKFLERLQVS